MDTQIRTRGAAWAQTVKEEQDLRGYTWEHQHDTYQTRHNSQAGVLALPAPEPGPRDFLHTPCQ